MILFGVRVQRYMIGKVKSKWENAELKLNMLNRCLKCKRVYNMVPLQLLKGFIALKNWKMGS